MQGFKNKPYNLKISFKTDRLPVKGSKDKRDVKHFVQAVSLDVFAAETCLCDLMPAFAPLF